MPTFQEIYNKHSAAISQGLISPDEPLSTFAQRGFQVTGDPSYKNVADGSWFSNAIRSRSADLSNFVESGPVDEWTSEAVGRIGDLFGITPTSSRAVGKRLPRMAVDFLPMAVGAAFAAPTGGASLIPTIGLAGTSALSAASAYEDTGRPLDAIIGGAAPYVGGKLSELGTRAALNLAAKSPALQRLGFTGGTKLAGQVLNKAEIDRLAADGFDAATIAGTTAARTMLDRPLDKILGYVGGEVAANTGFTALDIAQQGTDAVFNRDYLFANLISNVPFAAVDMVQSARTRQFGDTEFSRPTPQPVYRTPGEERSVRAADMFKDMEDPAQIEALKRRYGLDITNIELNAERLRAAQTNRTDGQKLATENFVSRWNSYLDSDPLLDKTTNGSLRITKVGEGEGDYAGLGRVLTNTALPEKAKELVTGFKQERATIKANYSKVVAEMVNPVKMEDALKRSVQELGLDEFLAKPIEERDYHDALGGGKSLLSPEGIDLVRDIHRKEADLEPLNKGLWQEFEDFYLGKKTGLDFDKRVDLAVAVATVKGNLAGLKKARAKGKAAQQEGQKDAVVLEEFVGKLEEDAKDYVQNDPKVQQGVKLAEAVQVEAEVKVEEQKVEAAKEAVRQAPTPEELATARVNLDNQLRAFVAKAEEAKRLREEAAQVVQEPVVQLQTEHPAMVELKKFVSTLPVKGQQAWASKMEDAQNYFTTGDEKYLPPVGDLKRNRLKELLTQVDPQVRQRIFEESRRFELEQKRNRQLREKASKKEALEESEVEELQPVDTTDLEELVFDGMPAVEHKFSWAKDKSGKSYLIPVPEGDFETVRPFAEKLMAEKVKPEAVKGFAEDLVELAKFLNNPEVVYARLKGVVEGQGDAQFARASAGAFDFGMREVVDGKLIRKDKPNNPLGTKDGWMTEQEFRVNGSDLGTLQKAEVEFYKQLVPEAFADGKVHLQKLWDGLNKVGESVKVDVYGQDVTSPEKAEFDSLVHNWYDNLPASVRSAVRTVENNPGTNVTVENTVPREHWENARRYIELSRFVEPVSTGPRATSYYNQVSPFDTKKYPVVRVDVSLPPRMGKVRTAAEFGMSDREYDRMPDKREQLDPTLWQQDDLHENLPNTLGWAMVQFVPDPRTGEMVAFVGEQQSRWGQERSRYSIEPATKAGTFDVWYRETGGGKRRVSLNEPSKESAQQYIDSKAPPHPILESQANLVLKAVIREAQKRGVKKVVVSDGESAMMTEGHDTSAGRAFNSGYFTERMALDKKDTLEREGYKNVKITKQGDEFVVTADARISQEGGMRLHYDTTLPSVMKKLTGGEGEMWDGGVHKNAVSPEQEDSFVSTFVATEAEAKQLASSLSEGQYFGPSEFGFQVEGYRIPKGSPVFRNPDGTRKSSVTGRIYDITNPSERVNTLFAQNAGKIFGAASYNQKKIFINSEAFNSFNPAEQIGFIFAHEHSHISLPKALEGAYGPEAKLLAQEFERWVMTADPQLKQVVRDVLVDLHMSKELRNSDGIREVLNNDDPHEWMANAMALYVTGAIKASKPKMAFAMLPKPVRNFFEWAIQGMQNLYKGAKTWMKLGGNQEALKQVSTLKNLMDTIRRSYRQAEWDAKEAEAFLRIQPEDMIQKATDLQFAKVSPSAKTGGAVFREEPLKVIKNTFDSAVIPMHTLARLHKGFVELVASVHQKHDRITNGIMEVEKTFFGGLSASGKVQIDSKFHDRVFSSKPLTELFDAIQRFAVVENKRVIQEGATPDTLTVHMENLSPELRGRLAQFKPEAQQALVHVLASMEMANRKSQEIFKAGFLREATTRLATMIQFKRSFNRTDFAKVPDIAKGVMTDLLNGDPVLARSKLDMLDGMEADKLIESAQLLAQKHVALADYYAKHPSYMSFRRFKKHKQRMEKPGVPDDVVDADTPGELQKVIKEQEAKGWKVKGLPEVQDKKSKEQFRMADELLQLVRKHDNELLENMKTQGLTAEQFDSLAKMINTEDEIARHINAKELYKPMGTRKFSGDLERFSALEQFMHYTPAAIHAVESRATEAEVNFWMQRPELENLQTEKDQFKALYEQSKTPDPEWARKLAKANAVWHIGWNLPGHIAETAQPFLSHLPELIARGDGAVKGLARIMRAEKEMLNVQRVRTKGIFSKEKIAKYTYKQSGQKDEVFEGIPAAWLQANGTKGDNLEIARALETLSNRIQRAPMSEILNSFDSKNHTNLERLSRGEPLAKAIDFIKKPFNMYVKGSMTFYSQFPMHNAVVAIVSSYRQAREQGFSPKDAIAKAELFDLSVNNSSGRLERPEMFNKLGGAGHLVYQLSSYVRGRFADLATFYRHGWSDDQYGLTPTEKKNARKAFQTMILAQVGAAGLLGMPFVGAGIALMEELLGEDIKGRMYEALDEVTNDPSLTHALTHGFASAFAESLGIPADMHSRFALSGFLGTNAYDGMSAKSFMGPSVAMLDSLWKLGGTMAQGKSVEEALTVGGPGGVKRLAEALSEDFQRDNPEASLAWSALGFRSTQMTKQKEFGRIVDRREMESRRELELAANRISDTLANPATARKTLFDEAMKLVPSGLNPLEQKQQLQQNIKDLAAKVSLLEANKVAPEDLRTQIAGRVAPQVANVGRSMGVQMNDPMELARSLAAQKTRSVLGQPLSQRPVRNAMMRDLQWGANPWEF